MTETKPFTSHRQVNNYLEKCYADNMDMENQVFYVNTKLMRLYFSPNDNDIKAWIKKHRLTVSCTLHSAVHEIKVNYLDEADKPEWIDDIETGFRDKTVITSHEDVVDVLYLIKRLNMNMDNKTFYIDQPLKEKYLNQNTGHQLTQWLMDNKLTVNNVSENGKYPVTINETTLHQPENEWTVISLDDPDSSDNEETPFLDQSTNTSDAYFEENESDLPLCKVASNGFQPLVGLRHRYLQPLCKVASNDFQPLVWGND